MHGILIFVFSNNRNISDRIGDSNYNSIRTAQNTSDTSSNNTSVENSQNENTAEISNPSKQKDKKNEEKNIESKLAKETEIASFTTKIYTKDSDRQNNVSIACSALNDSTVENGKTFSFSKTVGKATSSKGYKKADVFRNGAVIEALGGGLCQVSTTLYNAVLKVPGTKVVERHSHSNKVPYIKSGKDAAVSYGTYDFKFVNNTGNTLKIKASNTQNNITIKIMKLE